ncbi:MAG: PqiC family protein [Rickettsiales bacterium]|nr:PqiC family protein [Rickettsiales bacterium]
MKKIFCLLVILLLSSCIGGISIPSNFYNLISYDNTNIKTNYSKKNLVINIEPVVIPSYLDRPQIITLNGKDTEFNISETNRWAEPLADSIQRVLAKDIYSYMPKSVVRSSTIKITNADYLVYVVIDKFDGRFGDKLVLNAWWSILNKNGNVIITKNSNFTVDLENSDYNNLVKNYSQLVNKLAIEIGSKINKL